MQGTFQIFKEHSALRENYSIVADIEINLVSTLTQLDLSFLVSRKFDLSYTENVKRSLMS